MNGFWGFEQAHRDFVAIPNVPSEPMNAPRKSNPALSRRSLPSQVIFAVRQDHFGAQHVVRGDAVGEAVRSAGVLGHVTADGAGSLARRVRRVVQPKLGGCLGEFDVDDPRLDQRGSIARIDFDDPVIRVRAMTTDPLRGMAPPESPVPAPRGTILAPCRFAIRTAAMTSSAEPGTTTALGIALSIDPSYS